jgi:hypothetical protein
MEGASWDPAAGVAADAACAGLGCSKDAASGTSTETMGARCNVAAAGVTADSTGAGAGLSGSEDAAPGAGTVALEGSCAVAKDVGAAESAGAGADAELMGASRGLAACGGSRVEARLLGAIAPMPAGTLYAGKTAASGPRRGEFARKSAG